MRIFRFAIVAAAALVTALLILVAGLSSQNAQAQQHGIKLAPTPFTFSKIFEGPDVILESDTSSYTAMLDGNDELVVAGIFRLIRKNAAPGEKAVFVSMAAAMCGHTGIIVLHSKDFAIDGSPAGETTKPEVLAARKDTGAGAVYVSLCSAKVKPTPINPGYKVPDRYTKFWS